jgi:thiosulfate dehydrogenase (quinone) large subunit
MMSDISKQQADSKIVWDYSVATLLLRLMLGVLFFFAGLNKFVAGYSASVEGIIGAMKENSWLPEFMLIPYTYPLPFIEVILGFVLIIGFRTRLALFVAGLLLISLAFGKILTGEHVTVANNANYVFMAAVAWFFSRHDLFSLDSLLASRK